MKMTINRTKLLAIILFALPLLLFAIFREAPAMAASNADDPAVTYKAKCAACHTATASKFFDATKADADLVQVTMQGRKGEKPPYMPAFEAKGMTTDEATSLIKYMKGLKGGS
jgi:mono/diheme cytochrome c family protein